MEKVEEREPEHAELRIKGHGVGAMLSMQTSFDLAEGDGGTIMKWAADVRIAGPVGSMGQRVLQPIVNQQVSHVLSALDREVQNEIRTHAEGPKDYGPPADATPEADPPTGTSGAEDGTSPLEPGAYE
jgi:hypothetical protein